MTSMTLLLCLGLILQSLDLVSEKRPIQKRCVPSTLDLTYWTASISIPFARNATRSPPMFQRLQMYSVWRRPVPNCTSDDARRTPWQKPPLSWLRRFGPSRQHSPSFSTMGTTRARVRPGKSLDPRHQARGLKFGMTRSGRRFVDTTTGCSSIPEMKPKNFVLE
jgi:hypothetical protein